MTDSAEFGLVMPFVACASNGGPYDDEPYFAGFEAGIVDAVLAALSDTVRQCRRTVHSGNVPQLDLIAMQHGWTVTATPCDDPEWTDIHFHRETS